MRVSSTVTVLLLLVVGLGLAGCREEEQGRILLYEKGTYLGRPDTPLTAETVRALRDRVQYQRFGQ